MVASDRPSGENQPVLVQIDVPYGTRPGRYGGAITVSADGRQTTIPLRIRVFAVALPRPGTRVGNLLTSFNLSPESYVAKAAQLYGFTNHEQRVAANRSLFALLGSYRISPGSWGFGEPRGPGGYESSHKWWLDSAGNFVGQLRSTSGFSALRIPISSNRTAPAQLHRPAQPVRAGDVVRLPGSSARVLGAERGTRTGLPRIPLRLRRARADGDAPGRSTGQHASPLLPRRAAADDRQSVARERVPLGRARGRRPRHLDRALAPLLRDVDGPRRHPEREEPGAQPPER